jgi:hypothetical protein
MLLRTVEEVRGRDMYAIRKCFKSSSLFRKSPPVTIFFSQQSLSVCYFVTKFKLPTSGPCHHVMTRPQVADGGAAFDPLTPHDL